MTDRNLKEMTKDIVNRDECFLHFVLPDPTRITKDIDYFILKNDKNKFVCIFRNENDCLTVSSGASDLHCLFKDILKLEDEEVKRLTLLGEFANSARVISDSSNIVDLSFE